MSFESALPVYGRNMRRPVVPDPVLGTGPEPIDNDVLADCCLLLAIIAKTQPGRVAEFFNMAGSRHDKIAFLLRFGHFELNGRLTQ